MQVANEGQDVQNSTEVAAQRSLPTSFRDWLLRSRVPISLIGFTTLVAFNLGVLKTEPLDPLDWKEPLTLAAGLLVLAGLSIRSWAAGTLQKSAELTQIGPYALVRNPLYVGSFLMMFGFCALLRDIPTALFVAGPMVAIYWLTTIREESNLATWFVDRWPSYKSIVPRFIPKFYSSEMLGGWSLNQWRKNREYQAVLATLAGIIAIHLLVWL